MAFWQVAERIVGRLKWKVNVGSIKSAKLEVSSSSRNEIMVSHRQRYGTKSQAFDLRTETQDMAAFAMKQR